ncbi:MAG: type II toxin-antitoxin system VapC family toxin [Acidobacteriota bacterium]
MTLLFDTSAVVSLVERASQPVASLIRSVGDRPFVSFVTIAELHVGVSLAHDASTRAARERTLRRAHTFRQLPVDDAVLDHYARARQAGLRGNDAWIAAAARQIEATLVTADEVLAQRADGLVDVHFISA